MIQLTKLNREHITINALHIETVEARPDTHIALMTGKQVIVRESVQEVSDAVTAYYQNINLLGKLPGLPVQKPE